MGTVETLDRPDPVVEAYKRHVDRTLLERNLQLSPTERIAQLQQFVAFLAQIGEARERGTGRSGGHQAD